MRCKFCDQEFVPAKSWQEFHSNQCRDRWHYQERKRQQIEAAEDAAEDKRNGLTDDGAGVTLTLASLGIRSVEPMKRPERKL